MNLDIKKRIDSIAHPEAIKVFFNFINKFIKDNSISENDERFVLNVRNDYRKRFSVNLNSRLILYIKDGYEFGFMINQEDWSNFQNIPYIKKESFEKHDPIAFLVSFSFDHVIDNIDLFTKYWLKCCKEYLPSQQKSQYRIYHINELYQIAMDDELLDEYLTIDVTNMKLKFSQIINELKVYLLGENNILKDFKISEVKDNSKWVWISDNENQIGDSVAHYEIITRKNKIYTEIHFEGNKNSKDIFYNEIENLPNNIEWFKWQKSKSIRYNTAFDINDENLVEKLAKSLLYLEENIGDKVREVKNMLSPFMTKQKQLYVKNIPLNQILFGPPGTGKTYHTINKAIEIANPSFDLNQDRSIVKAEYNRLVNEGQIAFTTFHQSMSYEDFIEGIKPVVTNDNVTYEIINGIFKTLCFKSNETKDSSNFDDLYELFINEFIENESIVLKTPTHKKPFNIRINSNQSFIVIPQTEKAAEMVVTKKMIRDFIFYGKIRDWKPYTTAICEYFITNYPIDLVEDKKKNHVLIIDEINRGNVSQIFGELITLIEESKRLGNKEELKVTLPYSKEEFGVPNNLYIIGTMNTADRSVEALDTALRRRFSFTEMLPNPAIIDSQNFTDFPRAKIMKKINERIELLLDRNYMLGHAYFMKDNFKHSFENEIVPLLQEYFYNDYSKIGLVLGKGFVRIKATSLQNVSNVFADFDTIHDIDLIKTYELIPFNEINFEEALSLLIH